jgi:uncharacterized spore protein YtfJ
MTQNVGKIATYYLTEASKGKTGFLASLWGILMGYANKVDSQIYESLRKAYPKMIESIKRYVRAQEETFFESTSQYVGEYPEAKAEYLRYVAIAAYYAQLLGLIEDITDLLEKLEELETKQSEQEDEEEDSEEYEREEYFEIGFD